MMIENSIENIKPYTEALVMGIGGAKRNCKSLLMASSIVHKLIEGETVWSNMPVKTGPAILNRRYAPSGKLIKYGESNPLDWNLLYKLDESLIEGTIAIDEVGYQASSRQSMSTRNRLINGCIRQVGHRNLDFFWTARSFYRIDSNLRDETDVFIECEDLRFSPWGLQRKMPGGVVAQLKYYDISGAITGHSCYNGYSYYPDGYYQECNFYGTPYWDCYDTKNIISLEEAFTEVHLDLKRRDISNKDEDDDNKQSLKDNLYEGIAYFRKKGSDIVNSFGYWKYIKEKYDIDDDPKVLGRYLPREVQRKATHNGFMYDFSGVEL